MELNIFLPVMKKNVHLKFCKNFKNLLKTGSEDNKLANAKRAGQQNAVDNIILEQKSQILRVQARPKYHRSESAFHTNY